MCGPSSSQMKWVIFSPLSSGWAKKIVNIYRLIPGCQLTDCLDCFLVQINNNPLKYLNLSSISQPAFLFPFLSDYIPFISNHILIVLLFSYNKYFRRDKSCFPFLLTTCLDYMSHCVYPIFLLLSLLIPSQ